METRIELRFEMTPDAADEATAVGEEFLGAVREALRESGLEPGLERQPEIRFDQPLPMTPDQMALVIPTVQFLLKHGPDLWDKTRSFIRAVTERVRGARTVGVTGRIEAAGRRVEFSNLAPEAAQAFVPEAVRAVNTAVS